jgi:Spore germination B3/ GerAC like, C-terminal
MLLYLKQKESIRKGNNLNGLLTNRFKKLLEKTQRERTDVLGIGQHFRPIFRSSSLKSWKNSYYPKLSVSFKINVDIRNNGNLKTLSGD